jgi:hypothetical protein
MQTDTTSGSDIEGTYPAIDRAMSLLRARLFEQRKCSPDAAHVQHASEPSVQDHIRMHEPDDKIVQKGTMVLSLVESEKFHEPPPCLSSESTACEAPNPRTCRLRDLCMAISRELYLSPPRPAQKRRVVATLPLRVIDLLAESYNAFIVVTCFAGWKRRPAEHARVRQRLASRTLLLQNSLARGYPDRSERRRIVHKWGKLRLAELWDRRRQLRRTLLCWWNLVTSPGTATDRKT